MISFNASFLSSYYRHHASISGGHVGFSPYLILHHPKRLDPKFQHCSSNGLEDRANWNPVTLVILYAQIRKDQWRRKVQRFCRNQKPIRALHFAFRICLNLVLWLVPRRINSVVFEFSVANEILLFRTSLPHSTSPLLIIKSFISRGFASAFSWFFCFTWSLVIW